MSAVGAVDAVDVLVVGGGPAGLAAAVTLGRYGISTLLVERRPAPSSLPRATGLSTRTMELVRSWGLEEPVRAGGVDADVWLWECTTLAEAAAGQARSVGYPSRSQAALVSPTAPAAVPQDRLEAVLRDYLRTLPTVRTEVDAEVIGVDEVPGGLGATVQGRAGDRRRVEARYLVAADGAHSRIRRCLGVEMLEREGSYGGVQVVFHAPLWDLLGDLRYALYSVTTAAAPGLFLPAGPSDRWIYGAAPIAEDRDDPEVDPVRLAGWIRLGAGVDVHPVVERVSPFHSPGQIATRFRVGRTFLVGDAAHRVTPRGGTGLNTAVQDGHDLGWKLAWTLRGWADPGLLDTYEAERRPVAEHNLVRSTDPDGSRRPVLDELVVDLGGRLGHVWIPGRATATSTLDVLGPGWTRFLGPAAPADPATATATATAAPVVEERLDAVTARALGIGADGTLLVRPDGLPVDGVSGLRRWGRASRGRR